MYFMPKKSKDFPVQITLNVTSDLRQKLMALGYIHDGRGEYSTPARNILMQGVEGKIDALSPKERKDFDAILASVRTRDEVAKITIPPRG